MSKAAAEAATWYQRTFYGRADQVSLVRREIARHLGDFPAADDAVLIASELAANSVVHSASGAEFFTVRCQAYPGYVWIEVEDLGGPWHPRPPDDRPHGLDIIGALAGPGNWGTETTIGGERIVWHGWNYRTTETRHDRRRRTDRCSVPRPVRRVRPAHLRCPARGDAEGNPRLRRRFPGPNRPPAQRPRRADREEQERAGAGLRGCGHTPIRARRHAPASRGVREVIAMIRHAGGSDPR
jgi:hypothetical protein